jgi:hypothetical protein
MKGRFYEELENVFGIFPIYHMKLLLGEFNAKVCRGRYFQTNKWEWSLHEISNDNGFRVVKSATSKNFIARITRFPHRNIHNFTWTSPDGKP